MASLEANVKLMSYRISVGIVNGTVVTGMMRGQRIVILGWCMLN